MTKVQLEYDLVRPLTDHDAAAVGDVHSWYGIAARAARAVARPVAGGIRRLPPQRKRRRSRAAALWLAHPAQVGRSITPAIAPG